MGKPKGNVLFSRDKSSVDASQAGEGLKMKRVGIVGETLHSILNLLLIPVVLFSRGIDVATATKMDKTARAEENCMLSSW
jgi:hypothetical protein